MQNLKGLGKENDKKNFLFLEDTSERAELKLS